MSLFVWTDIAIVQCVCAAPLAWLATNSVRRFLGVIGTMGVAVLAMAVALVIQFMFMNQVIEQASLSFANGVGMRAAIAFIVVFSGTLLLASLTRTRWFETVTSVRQQIPLTIVAVAVCVLVPAVFVAARCRHDTARLDELIDQERIGEASDLAEKLARLDPWRKVRDQQLANVEIILKKEVERLNTRVSAPLASGAARAERLERGRDLARLGRTQEALESLTPLTDVDAEILRGVIHETRGEWQDGLAAYERARAEVERKPLSDSRNALLKTATSGVAYCQRKAGRYDEAEIAYLKLLDLAPTADTHFLLAQFYDDAQDAQKAHQHARRAMELAPARYRDQGEKLIRKLKVSQFGCLRAL